MIDNSSRLTSRPHSTMISTFKSIEEVYLMHPTRRSYNPLFGIDEVYSEKEQPKKEERIRSAIVNAACCHGQSENGVRKESGQKQ